MLISFWLCLFVIKLYSCNGIFKQLKWITPTQARWWNKIVTYNILLLSWPSSLFLIHHIKVVWLLFFLIQLCSLMFLEVQSHSLEVCPLLQVQLLMCYVLFLVRFSISLSTSLSFWVFTKFDFIFMRWRLFLYVTLSLSFDNV